MAELTKYAETFLKHVQKKPEYSSRMSHLRTAFRQSTDSTLKLAFEGFQHVFSLP